ncbi:hypothetical protein [Methylophaga sp.]
MGNNDRHREHESSGNYQRECCIDVHGDKQKKNVPDTGDEIYSLSLTDV